ncbi:MAG: HAD family hydrolase [Spirochaetales bacterium]|jgi:putative hydrolase of the HAD superfamily|nr:HAD family hydrolase [Spirochaetales bacterium]
MENSSRYVELIRRFSPPACPLPVREELPAAQEPPPCGRKIRAYLFDVYGTLFMSASGDISFLDAQAHNQKSAARLQNEKNAQEIERVKNLLEPFGTNASLPSLREIFTSAVRAGHEKLRPEKEYPEIDVRTIWADALCVSPEEAPELALRFELAVNPVYPMPGLAAFLAALKKTGRPLGIVSNAQFFTPLLFEAFLGAPPGELGFLSELCTYSFLEGEAKPSQRLFRASLKNLAPLGLDAEDTLYTGNDMRNDIWPAASAGLTTALFAGDARSLRLRKNDARCARTQPAFVVKTLEEILLL